MKYLMVHIDLIFIKGIIHLVIQKRKCLAQVFEWKFSVFILSKCSVHISIISLHSSVYTTTLTPTLQLTTIDQSTISSKHDFEKGTGSRLSLCKVLLIPFLLVVIFDVMFEYSRRGYHGDCSMTFAPCRPFAFLSITRN